MSWRQVGHVTREIDRRTLHGAVIKQVYRLTLDQRLGARTREGGQLLIIAHDGAGKFAAGDKI